MAEASMTTTNGAAGAALGSVGRSWVRQRDRRNGINGLLASLAQGLRDEHATAALRERFESALRQLVSVRSVRLRETSPQFTLRPSNAPSSAESLCFDIPISGQGRRALLEATLDRATKLDEWDFQTLGAAAHLASFVLEIERAAALGGGNGKPGRRCHADGAAPLIGSSPVMHALRERIERLALTDFTVLIEGESGTGKELVARQIHDLSRRSRGPFVAINCAALVETLVEAELFGIEERTATGVKGRRGKFEHAQGGTLFLDEVSDLSVSAQAKLLRAIQDLAVERVGGHGSRHVDIRILVATNRGLADLVDRGLFRQDLYYRLSGVELHVPSLRTRREDIPELADYFLARYRSVRSLEFYEEARDVLRLYDWPGNVRELERLVESVVALARTQVIEVDDLPAAVRGKYAEVLLPSIARGESLRAFGSRYVRLVLAHCSQNKRRACQVLGISYHTLRAYMEFEPWGRSKGDASALWPGTPTCNEPRSGEPGRASSPAENADGRVTSYVP
jgi:DNA-binding NtrC family response regulator